MEDRIDLAVMLVGIGIAALLWPRPSDSSDGLRLVVTLAALFIPFATLLSPYLVSRAFAAHITAWCRPNPRKARYPHLLFFVAIYAGFAAVGETVLLRGLSALLLVASLVIYPAFWRFAQRYPIEVCESS